MYFPWVGLLEQIRLADVFVHYDDVQFSKGGFSNRVQIKMQNKTRWITVPTRRLHLGQNIDEVEIGEGKDWRGQHRDILRQCYQHAPFRDDMLALVDSVFEQQASSLADISRISMLELADYFGLTENCHFVDSKSLGIEGKSSKRVLDIIKKIGGTEYITGHGARNYLDHELFERSGVTVQYMQYKCTPYPQQYGDFTPYVSALDLVANCGREGIQVIKSEANNWREFIYESD